jgi:hypothetical protein
MLNCKRNKSKPFLMQEGRKIKIQPSKAKDKENKFSKVDD